MHIKWNRWKLVVLGALVGIGVPLTASAETKVYDGVEFTDGDDSFVESVISFQVDDPGVSGTYEDPAEALGPPDYDHSTEVGSVSLGNSAEGETPGEVIVAFDSNRLVDIEGDDLYIFEVGPQVEASTVAISIDAESWYDVGKIEGSTRGLDLADHPNVPERRGFRYVRIRDFPDGSTSNSPSAGPDIDAVGAIGSVAASEFDEEGRFISDQEEINGGDEGCACSSTSGDTGSVALFAFGLVVLLGLRKRKTRSRT